jgi:hypothetical protein
MLNAHLARGAVIVVVATNAETSIGSIEKHDGSTFGSGRIGTIVIGFTVFGFARVGFIIANKTGWTVRVHLARNAFSDSGALLDIAGAGEGVGTVSRAFASGNAHVLFASHVGAAVEFRQTLNALFSKSVTNIPARGSALRIRTACRGRTSTVETDSKRTVRVSSALNTLLVGAETVVGENTKAIHIRVT